MKYFITETERRKKECTAYIEFQKDSYHNEVWQMGSLCMYCETFEALGLTKLFQDVITDFDYYGINKVTKEQWQQLHQLSKTMRVEVVEAFSELNEWVEECFRSYDTFCILGL